MDCAEGYDSGRRKFMLAPVRRLCLRKCSPVMYALNAELYLTRKPSTFRTFMAVR